MNLRLKSDDLFTFFAHRLKTEKNVLESAASASNLEVGELHSAMAGLHCELQVLQREVDQHKDHELAALKQREEAQIKLVASEADLSKCRSEFAAIRSQDTMLTLRLETMTQSHQQVCKDYQQSLEEIRSSHNNLENSHQTATLQLQKHKATNQELNTMLGSVHGSLEKAKKELEERKAAAEVARASAAELQSKVRELSDTLANTERTLLEREAEHTAMVSDLSMLNTLKARVETLNEDYKKQTKRVSELELEKQENIMELSRRCSDGDALAAEVSIYQSQIEGLKTAGDKDKKIFVELEQMYKDSVKDIQNMKDDAKEQKEQFDRVGRQVCAVPIVCCSALCISLYCIVC